MTLSLVECEQVHIYGKSTDTRLYITNVSRAINLMLIKELLHVWRPEELRARAVYVQVCVSCTHTARNQDTQTQASHRGHGHGKNFNLETPATFHFQLAEICAPFTRY
jgi:hypothetical protein